MLVDINIKNFFYGLFNLLDSGIAEFLYFTAIGKNYMVVLVVKIRFLILSLSSSKFIITFHTLL